MNKVPNLVDRPEVSSAVCAHLLALASIEEEEALRLAQATPYWALRSREAINHTATAEALRAEVERLRNVSGAKQGPDGVALAAR